MSVTIYIVECSDGSYYTGLTRKPVEERVWEHNAGVFQGYTHARRPVILRFVEHYERINEATDREQQIKRWSRRKKEALIAGDYEGLPDIARGRSREPVSSARPRGSTSSP